MTLDEEIISLEKMLSELSQPSLEIPSSTAEFDDATCEIHGSFQQRRRISTTHIKIPAVPSHCPGCIRDELIEPRAGKIHIDETSHKRNIEVLMEALDIPNRFLLCTLQDYEPVNEDAQRILRVYQAYANRWPERLRKGDELVMCGKPGAGKNHLAFGVARIAIAKHQSSAVFTVALKTTRRYKSAWSKGSTRTEGDVIRYFTKPDLLIIDGVDVQFGNDTGKLIMFEVINTRYEHMKPIILISSQTKEELSAFIGEHVIDRMSDGGGCTLSFTWDPYRSEGTT